MSRIVFVHELRSSLRTFLWWTIPVGAMVAMTAALQPSLANGPLAAKLDSMPTSLRKAFGIEALDFHRPVAYLATNFATVALTTALFAALLGAASIAKEETQRTAEVLYVQPISRTRILLGKLAAVVMYSLSYPVALAIVAMIVLAAVADRPLEPVAVAALFVGAAAVALCFAGIGLLAATLVRDKRAATGAALGAVLGSYFLGVISAIAPSATFLRYASPHKLLEATAITMQGLSLVRVVVILAVGGAAAALAIARYRRADIQA